jgi:hypothetical protein
MRDISMKFSSICSDQLTLHDSILLASGSKIAQDVPDPSHAPEKFSDSPTFADN